MIDSLYFENYKGFRQGNLIKIRPITLLIGKNSSGKSSIAKLFPLLENSLSQKIEEPLLLSNNNVSLGGEFRDLVYNRLPNSPIIFQISYKDGISIKVSIVQNQNDFNLTIFTWDYESPDTTLRLRFSSEDNKYVGEDGKLYSCDFKGFIPTAIIDDTEKNIVTDMALDSFLLNVDYIGPFRQFPERQFLLSGQMRYRKTGSRGEKAYHILGISERLDQNIHKQVEEWYSDNFDGWRLVVNSDHHPFLEIRLEKEETSVNIADVGQGISQALPLIVRGYYPQKDSIIVIEQPELHLHPAAHGQLIELFAESAKLNQQNFIIETHSENILLRLRRLILEKKFDLTPEDFVIYFVDQSEEGGHELMEITIDENGVLSDWPDGVFNEALDETIKIRKALTIKKQ